MKKDKSRLILMAVFMLVPLTAALLYGLEMMNKEKLNSGGWFPFIIVLLLILFMFVFIVKRYRDVKQGMPMEDEMSRRIKTRAAATSFYITLYWLLAISIFESFFAKFFGANELTASQTVGGGIAGMSLIFFICWFYYSKRGADKPQRPKL